MTKITKKSKKKASDSRVTGRPKRPAVKAPLVRLAEAAEPPKTVTAYRTATVQMEEVEGSIWCDVHGCVHDDETDPYSYGYAESGETPECDPSYWRKLYMPPLKD